MVNARKILKEHVADVLATHLGEPDPLPEESFAVTVGDDGHIRCGCGWTGCGRSRHGRMAGAPGRRHSRSAGEGRMNGVDAFAAVADRLDLFADRVRYERVLACRDVADWCRAQDGADMTAADAFEAVADYCDIAAHAMPVLGSYVGFERYVAYGGIAGWCRKAGRDAWVHQTKGAHDGQDEEPVRVRKGEGRRGIQRPV